MRAAKTHNAAILLALLLSTALLSSSPHAQEASHRQHSQEAGLSREALGALVDGRRELITQELAGHAGGEWAGEYYAQDGPTAGTQLLWSPAAGFLIRWSTCCHGWRERVNYGGAAFEGGALKLKPELSGKGANVYPVGADFIPVLWGQQHYLIPAARLINFCYAFKNAGNAPEMEAFLLKTDDREKPSAGLPGVPPEFRKYLHSKPLVALISQVRPWSPGHDLTLNVGREDGVVAGMKFYASSPRNVFMLVEVTEVGERTSSAYVVTSGYRNQSDDEVRPRVGWKLTSRAPSDASSYFPG